jgi:hypothetical protein
MRRRSSDEKYFLLQHHGQHAGWLALARFELSGTVHGGVEMKIHASHCRHDLLGCRNYVCDCDRGALSQRTGLNPVSSSIQHTKKTQTSLPWTAFRGQLAKEEELACGQDGSFNA